MDRLPGARTAPYWTLVAVALLMAVPFSWAAGVLIGCGVLQFAWTLTRGRAARPEAPSPGRVALGVDQRGRQVVLDDGQLSTHGLIVGASGAGKSTTLLRILTEQIAAGRPVIAIDLKGSREFAGRLAAAAAEAGRPFQLWTPDGPGLWNPLAHGNPTELKDKLIGTERFTEPHYKRAAERYVQLVLITLKASERPIDLESVTALMEPRRLAALARELPWTRAEQIQDYLGTLGPDQVSAVRGLGTRLALLGESQAGPYLAASRPETPGIDLRSALQGPEVVVFSLNSSRYGQLAAQLGTLAIQDLVSAAGHRLELPGRPPPATIGVDEFSALGSDHVLQLLARGREAGLSILLATQELADLERAAPGFRDQVLGLTAVKIVHRQDVPSSASTIAQMAGTEQVWEYTHQLRSSFARGGGSRGTRRQVERFLVHPNEIKRLGPGQAVVLAKTPTPSLHRTRITPARAPNLPRATPGSAPNRARATPTSALERPDQPEPGVTR
jgi:conjugal transfer pilus assembly protein TraD